MAMAVLAWRWILFRWCWFIDPWQDVSMMTMTTFQYWIVWDGWVGFSLLALGSWRGVIITTSLWMKGIFLLRCDFLSVAIDNEWCCLVHSSHQLWKIFDYHSKPRRNKYQRRRETSQKIAIEAESSQARLLFIWFCLQDKNRIEQEDWCQSLVRTDVICTENNVPGYIFLSRCVFSGKFRGYFQKKLCSVFSIGGQIVHGQTQV